MTQKQMHKRFPKRVNCIQFLEKVIWEGLPICPYCKSKNQTPMPEEHRYHCNTCNTSYSVTTKTIFHKTKIDLQKWFIAIPHIATKKISARQLGRDIGVTKDTALFMVKKIKQSISQNENFLKEIIHLK